MGITSYCPEKKPQIVEKNPAHSSEHLGKADGQKADSQDYTGGRVICLPSADTPLHLLPTCPEVLGPMNGFGVAGRMNWLWDIGENVRIKTHLNAWKENMMLGWRESTITCCAEGNWGSRGWGQRKLLCSSVGFSKEVWAPHYDATIKPDLYKIVLIKSSRNST